MDRAALDYHVWTVAQAKAHLSEVLRLAETEGPQVIGLRRPCIVLSKTAWLDRSPDRKPLGKWLIDNMPRGVEIPLPDRNEPNREIPFA